MFLITAKYGTRTLTLTHKSSPVHSCSHTHTHIHQLHIHQHIHTIIDSHIHQHVHTLTNALTHPNLSTHLHTYTNTSTHSHTLTHPHTRTYTCTHSHGHLHTHTLSEDQDSPPTILVKGFNYPAPTPVINPPPFRGNVWTRFPRVRAKAKRPSCSHLARRTWVPE